MARIRQVWLRMLQLFSQKGWRHTAIVNVVLAFSCDLVLLIALVVSISQPGASLFEPIIIFDGNCATSSRLNTLLHILINVISTAVLASSNFFMQILSAPSRQEINRAHTWLQSLDIGIPSIKNLWHVSRLKSASWLILFTSSIPIHLLFNSCVFETTYVGSQWYLTFATEAFTRGAAFCPPGASLSIAGSLGPTFIWNGPADIGGYGEKVSFEIGGYGEKVSFDQYSNASSLVRQKIASVADESHAWTFLTTSQCQSEYFSCSPRKKFGDVVFILDSTASKEGWTRSDVFTFDPSTDLSTRWDILVPPNVTNSLWFSSQCNTTRQRSSSGRDDECMNTCLGAMGLDKYEFPFNEKLPMVNEPWLISFFPAVRHHNKSLSDEGLGFNDKFDSLRVDHCLAQPIQPFCKVGLSNILLLVVILSILIKISQTAVIVWKLPSASLVTPGDVIESFILSPDFITQGLGTVNILDAQQIEFGVRRHWDDTLDLQSATKVRPRKWKEPLHRVGYIIPYSTWIKTYSLLFAALALLSAGFAASSLSTRNDYSESLDHSNGVLTVDVSGGYIATLLLANTPQLILSLSYFSYNSLLTQLHVEKEWNTYSVSYQPLRVSYPTGKQISTYRLQLPYKYSVPLIVISITLHWLVSNAVFLFVNEGGYWGTMQGSLTFYDAFSVSDGSLIGIGFSPLFFLVIFIAGFVFIICPPVLLGFLKMKGNMVAGGWNSLVISAACHVSDVENKQHEQASVGDNGSYSRDCTESDYIGVDISLEEDEPAFDRRLDITRRKLRWGAMELPRGSAESISTEGNVVSHLGFGGEEHNISEPIAGQYYI